MPRSTGPALLLVAVGLSALAAGCSPKIGDACAASIDCEPQGQEQRFCDTTQPGGYCTKFACEPNKCPDGMCVAFGAELDQACGPYDDARWPRFRDTFCMAACEEREDCRSGYECVAPTELGARIVDSEPLEQKICVPARDPSEGGQGGSTEGQSVGAVPGVCKPKPEQPPWTPYEAAGGAGGAGGGDAGAGGTAGAGGAGGGDVGAGGAGGG